MNRIIYYLFILIIFSIAYGIKYDDDYRLKGILIPAYTELKKNSKGELYPAEEFELKEETKINNIVFPEYSKVEFDENFNLVYAEISDEVSVNGIKYPSGSKFLFNKDGTLNMVKLGNSLLIDGIYFQTESKLKFKNNKLVLPDYFELAEDSIINGIKYLKNYTVYTYPDTSRVAMGTLAENTKIQGYNLSKETTVRFYPDGKLYSITTPKDIEINGMVFENWSTIYFNRFGTIDYSVKYSFKNNLSDKAISLKNDGYDFYISGLFKKGVLESDSFASLVPLPSGIKVNIGKNGLIEMPLKFTPQYNVKYKNIKFEKGYEIYLYTNGNIQSGRLYTESFIDKVLYKENSEIEFYYAGNVKRGTLKTNSRINNYNCEGDNEIEFYENSALKSAKIIDDVKVGNIYAKGNNRIIFHRNGKIKECTLKENYQSGNIIIAKDSIGGFFEDETINYGTLAEKYNYTINKKNITLPVKTRVSFASKDVLSSIIPPEDLTISKYTFLKNKIIDLYTNNGFIRKGYLAEIYEDTTGLRVSTNTEVLFYDNGSFEKLTLAEENVEYNGAVYKGGTVISFFKNGIVKSGALAEEYEYKGLTFKPIVSVETNEEGTNKIISNIYKTSIMFYENGNVMTGVLSYDASYNNIYIKGSVTFYENGNLSNSVSAQNQTIKGIFVSENSSFSLYQNGNIRSLFVKDPIEVSISKSQKVWLKKGSNAEFYENGYLKSGRLYQDETIQNIICKQNTQIEFYPDGKLKLCTYGGTKKITLNGITFEPDDDIYFSEDGKAYKNNYLK